MSRHHCQTVNFVSPISLRNCMLKLVADIHQEVQAGSAGAVASLPSLEPVLRPGPSRCAVHAQTDHSFGVF